MIEFTVFCKGAPQTIALETTVALGGQLLFKESDMTRTGGIHGALHKQIQLPKPPLPTVDVCVELNGEKYGTCNLPA